MKSFDKQMEMVLYHSDEGDVSVDAYIMNDVCGLRKKLWQSCLELINLASAGIGKGECGI